MKTMNSYNKLLFTLLMSNLIMPTQASELSRRINFDESQNIELHYDLGAEYYSSERKNLQRLAISLRQNPLQYFQDLTEEEIIACQKRNTRANFMSKMSPEEKVKWAQQQIRFKLLKKRKHS